MTTEQEKAGWEKFVREDFHGKKEMLVDVDNLIDQIKKTLASELQEYKQRLLGRLPGEKNQYSSDRDTASARRGFNEALRQARQAVEETNP